MPDFNLWSKIADQVARGVDVRHTSLANLNTKTFHDGGQKIVAIQQNPRTSSEWAALARQGHSVVQFKDVVTNKYLGVSVDGKIKKY